MEVTRAFGVIVASGALALAGAATSKAQCAGMTGFMNIGTVEQNPFEAERKVTHPDSQTAFTRHFDLPAEKIARDSQGRVRIERVAGKYKMDTGPEAGMEVEQHLIMICDPANQTLTQIDSVHKTATILRRLEVIARPKASNLQAIPLCAGVKRVLQGISSEIEDLGHRNVDGVDAQGWRVTRKLAIVSEGQKPTGTFVEEEWCSDELAAVVLKDQHSGNSALKTVTTLLSVRRGEPDPGLFQIPPDYTVSERVPQEFKPRGMRLGTLTEPNAGVAEQHWSVR